MGFKVQEKRRPGEISKLNRKVNNHTSTDAVHNEMLLCMAGLGLSTNRNSTVVKGSAVTAKDGNLVNEQEWIKYIN